MQVRACCETVSTFNMMERQWSSVSQLPRVQTEVDTGEPAEAPSSASLECTAAIRTLMKQGGRRGLMLKLSSSIHKRAASNACPHSHTQTCVGDTETTICTLKEIQHLIEQGNTKQHYHLTSQRKSNKCWAHKETFQLRLF